MNAQKMLGGAIVGVAIVGAILAIAMSDDAPSPAPSSAATTTSTSAPTPVETVEALVFADECYTPCSMKINYRAKIRGEGNPLRITFPGVNQPVDYPGEGDFKAPTQMRSGATEFVSLNEARPHVRVQLYKKLTATIRR